MMRQPSFSDKVVVITGASSGVGRAIAIELALKGAQLVLAARRAEALNEVARECTELGGAVTVVTCDTREAADMQRLAARALEWGGRIDVWINNAGVLAAGALEEIPAAVNEAIIRTNLIGYINGAQAVLPHFKARGEGILINNISVGGWFPTPYMSAYSASKFGLRGFFESLKGELETFPAIRICNLYPGFLDTPGLQHAANFTGKELKPAPPVYDPRKVARAVTDLILKPKGKRVVGAASTALRIAYHLFPSLSRKLTAGMIRNYLKAAPSIAPTSGNVLQPVEYGTGIDGGWRNVSLKPAPHTRKQMLAAGLLTAAVVFALKR